MKSAELKTIREKLNLTQAQMAGLVGVNRSYLAELEAGRRPLADWILRKAHEVQRRMSGVPLTASQGIPNEGDSWEDFDEEIAMLTYDELAELTDHITESIDKAPRVALTFYQRALRLLHREIRKRMIHGKSPGEQRGGKKKGRTIAKIVPDKKTGKMTLKKVTDENN